MVSDSAQLSISGPFFHRNAATAAIVGACIICAVFTALQPLQAMMLTFVAALTLFCLVYYPFAPLVLLVGIIPLDTLAQLSPGNPVFSITKIIFVPYILFIFWKMMLQRESVFVSRQDIFLLLFGFALLLSSLFMDHTFLGINALRKYFSYFLLYFVIVQMVKTRRQLLIILLTIIISCMISGLIGKVSGLGLQIKAIGGPERLTGMSVWDPNNFAALILTGFFIATVFFIESTQWRIRAAFFAAMCILLYSIILSLSRGTSLSLAVGTLFLIGLYRKKIPPIYLIGFPCLIALCTIPFIPGAFWERMGNLFDSQSLDTSLWRRFSYHVLGLQVFIKNPILGIGPGNFPPFYASIQNRFMVATYLPGRVLHNTYFNVLVETGLMGFIPFVLFFGTAFHSVWKIRSVPFHTYSLYQAIPKALTVALFAFLFTSFFLFGVYIKYLWILPACAHAMQRIFSQGETWSNTV